MKLRLGVKCPGCGKDVNESNPPGWTILPAPAPPGHVVVFAACPNLTYACDTHYPWQTERDEVVAGGRIRFVDGCVAIPDRPGLGVELDYDQLARGRERYEKIPLRKRDDEAEMRQRVDPEWKRVLPRW